MKVRLKGAPLIWSYKTKLLCNFTAICIHSHVTVSVNPANTIGAEINTTGQLQRKIALLGVSLTQVQGVHCSRAEVKGAVLACQEALQRPQLGLINDVMAATPNWALPSVDRRKLVPLCMQKLEANLQP